MDDNKLACFFAKIKKLVADYMAYCDMAIRTTSKGTQDAAASAKDAAASVKHVENTVGEIDAALDVAIRSQESLITDLSICWFSYIDTKIYFPDGMTWREFCASDYNNDAECYGYPLEYNETEDDYVYDAFGCVVTLVRADGDRPVLLDDTIIPGANYYDG